jgi:hypothetical protein
MPNKAKFRNAKNELKPLYYKELQENIGVFADGKRSQNKPKAKPKFTCCKGCKAKQTQTCPPQADFT